MLKAYSPNSVYPRWGMLLSHGLRSCCQAARWIGSGFEPIHCPIHCPFQCHRPRANRCSPTWKCIMVLQNDHRGFPQTIDFRIRACPMVMGGTFILDKPHVDGYRWWTGVRLVESCQSTKHFRFSWLSCLPIWSLENSKCSRTFAVNRQLECAAELTKKHGCRVFISNYVLQ